MKFILILMVFGAVTVRADLVENLEDLLKLVLHLDPDTGLSIDDFVDKYNYALETHKVVTEDGYILTLHRIPHRKSGSVNGPEETTETNITRPVVLLMHGLLCSSPVWLWQGPNASLAFELVDQGYDVWLANARGNSYSNKHVSLTIKEPAFWNFSFHEIGYYDLASSIDYILNVTEVERVTYVGHSQGTTTAAVLTSSRPEYNEKLNLVALFSPVIYLTHVRSPIVRFLAENDELVKKTLELFGIYGVARSQYLGLVADTLCNAESPVQGLCIFLIELLVGFDVAQIDKSTLTVLLTHIPSGTSYKAADHYVQEIPSGIFRQFDYGNPTKNYQQYGSGEPPSYNISQIKAPMAIYYGKNDYLNGVEDAEKFISELETEIVDQYLIEYDGFSHFDFLTAIDVNTILYDRVIDVIKKSNPVPGS